MPPAQLTTPRWALALWLAAAPVCLAALLFVITGFDGDPTINRSIAAFGILSVALLAAIWLYVTLFVVGRRLFARATGRDNSRPSPTFPALLVATVLILAGSAWAISRTGTCTAVGWYLAWEEDNSRYPYVFQRTDEYNCRSPGKSGNIEGIWWPAEYGDWFYPSTKSYRRGRIRIDQATHWAIADKFLGTRLPTWGDQIYLRFEGQLLVDPMNPSAPPTYYVARILDARVVKLDPAND